MAVMLAGASAHELLHTAMWIGILLIGGDLTASVFVSAFGSGLIRT